ncbi:hypothetical protein [Maledivibacter halophilus]|uniref:Uncharacterized protein n=1 Tax=Maledivibacter halophilus TaxID=36842 RepID=A0A1T5JDH4_9FIRM|nr:hypothetical protein [Maledivibacter halophilus]SKC49445.1 hypothetical protein SAMN02194393_01113 [Maledivibacter halophilus]
MKNLYERISSNIKNIQKDRRNLNKAINIKNNNIENLKNELINLKKLYNLIKDFDYLPYYKSKLIIYFIESRIYELEIIIQIESLNKKLIQRFKYKEKISEKKKALLIYVHNFINKLLGKKNKSIP